MNIHYASVQNSYTEKISVHRLHHLQYAGCSADSEQPLHRFRAYRCAKVFEFEYNSNLR